LKTILADQGLSSDLDLRVELRRFELLTSCMPMLRATAANYW
jgi:hypothetical protein